MIFPVRKSGANAPRAPDNRLLTLDSPSGWHLDTVGADAALKVTAVYRAVTYIAETISIMPYYLYDSVTREHITNHPLLEVLTQRPNEIMTPAVYKYTRQVHRLLTGNSYVYIARSNRTGRVEELLPLAPSLVKRFFDPDNHLHYLYTDPKSGDVFDLLPNQVLDAKAFTTDGITGVTPLTYAREVIGKDLAAQKYHRALYQNGGRPSGVLYTDSNLSGKSEETDQNGNPLSKKEVIRRAWNRVYAGTDNAFRTAVLDLGLKYEPIAMNNSDAQFVESLEVTVADIGRIFGVPLHALMSGKQSYESNSQNRIEFVQTTGLNIVTADDEEYSYKLLSLSDRGKHIRVRQNMDAALRGDTKSRMETYRIQREMGSLNVNEIRAKEDLPEIPGGDIYLARLDSVPLEDYRRISQQRNGGET